MKTVKVSVGKGGHVGITCPHCEKNHDVSVGKFKRSKHNLVTKCTCQKKFKVELNFRQFYRKNVKFVGEFMNISTGSSDWYTMIVTNLSMIGIRFKVIGSSNVENGHQLRVKFTLDNQKATCIEREVTVINIDDYLYGCEFFNQDYQKDLGFYLRT
jgi:hypothetical protein